jgi:hypothetical protein
VLLQFKTYKIVYRRYAGLFFSVGIDVSDNELTALEAIHLFVEILDHYFSNVCELDLVFNFHKVYWKAAGCAAVCAGQSFWLAAEGSERESSGRGWRRCTKHMFQRETVVFVLRACRTCVPQVYLILDEFILGGEFEETSKKVRRRRRCWRAPASGSQSVCVLTLLLRCACRVRAAGHPGALKGAGQH